MKIKSVRLIQFLPKNAIRMNEMDFKADEKYYHLESERLSYRALTIEDCSLWLPFFDDTPSLRFLGMGSSIFEGMNNAQKCEKWISRQLERQKDGVYGQLAVIEKSTGKFIGLAGLIARFEENINKELEVTYSLLKEARGKGYATELAIFFRDYAFENTSLPSVISIIHQDNFPSMNVAEKNGMQPENEFELIGMPVRCYRIYR